LKLHRFPKSERLRSKKVIESLFNPANSSILGGNVFLYPFKIVWLKSIEDNLSTDKLPSYPQILVSISKRNFKKATDRNRIRRQIKEAYRLNKADLFKDEIFPMVLGIIYVAKEKNEFVFIKKKLVNSLKKMLEVYRDSV
jgi:ribonuclease P protein component